MNRADFLAGVRQGVAENVIRERKKAIARHALLQRIAELDAQQKQEESKLILPGEKKVWMPGQ